MQIDYTSQSVPADHPQTLQKSISGKMPVLELEDGMTCITEPISIAKHFSHDKLGFYGPDAG